MNLSPLTPREARQMLDAGRAVLIDIREPVEFARERIPGARLASIEVIETVDFTADKDKGRAAIFHCASGARTRMNAERLVALGFRQNFVLDGGLQAWKHAGLPTRLDTSQPIELMRQVQIAAGSLVLLGALLAAFVDPRFVWLSGFVGAGLLFAGVTGFCGMARLLALMPWNRVAPHVEPQTA